MRDRRGRTSHTVAGSGRTPVPSLVLSGKVGGGGGRGVPPVLSWGEAGQAGGILIQDRGITPSLWTDKTN